MKEIEGLIKGESVPTEIIEEEEEAAATPFYDDVKEKADESISDAISSINPYDFQDLVAALLRSMGFRTAVSPPGPDRGVDIIAHPDAFGFQNPRIKVQVKHRTSAASGPDLRNFIATLRDGESGLFVSTGGFTRDGLSEPERSTRPVTLIDRDAFVDLLIENYENLEPEYKALIRIKKVYIPAKM
jgi:restriction system protein